MNGNDNDITGTEQHTDVIDLDKARAELAAKPRVETDAEGFIGRDLSFKAAKKPPRTAVITFPEWTDWAGAKVRIKEIRGGQKSRIDAGMIKGKAGDNRIDSSDQDASLIIAATINADGSQMYDMKRDFNQVNDFPASVTEFWVAEIRKLFQKPDEKPEDALGNSTSTASSS